MKTTKLIAILLAVVLCVSLFGCAKQDTDTTTAANTTENTEGTGGTEGTEGLEDPIEQIEILFTSDVHNAYQRAEAEEESEAPVTMGYAALAAYANALKKEGKTVVLIDGGDHLQGEAVGTLSKGSYLVDIMNKVGYTLAVPGNHEFDFGMDTFLELAQKSAKYDYISCNFMDLSTGESVFAPYKLVHYGDTTVAYVGISTPETFTKSTPIYFQDAEGNYIYGFCEGNEGQDLYDRVQSAINLAKAEGADYVIAVGHLGMDPESTPWTSGEVIANTTGLTAFLDGHAHAVIEGEKIPDKDNNAVTLVGVGSKLVYFGQISLNLVDGTVSTRLISGYAEDDEDVKTFTDDIAAKFADQLDEVVASSKVKLITHNPEDADDRVIREMETNLGDLCADAYRTLLGADVAFVNGGGIRAEISEGDVTYGDIINVHPFGNMACVVEATGQEILDALELAYASVGQGESGGFLQVSGITLTIDTSVASSVKTDEKGNFVRVSGARRVKDVKINGEPIDPKATYTVASHNYMLKSGGDGYTMFMDNTVLQDEVMIDNQVLITYIQDSLGGVIPADLYGNAYGEGRITIQ